MSCSRHRERTASCTMQRSCSRRWAICSRMQDSILSTQDRWCVLNVRFAPVLCLLLQVALPVFRNREILLLTNRELPSEVHHATGESCATAAVAIKPVSGVFEPQYMSYFDSAFASTSPVPRALRALAYSPHTLGTIVSLGSGSVAKPVDDRATGQRGLSGIDDQPRSPRLADIAAVSDFMNSWALNRMLRCGEGDASALRRFSPVLREPERADNANTIAALKAEADEFVKKMQPLFSIVAKQVATDPAKREA